MQTPPTANTRRPAQPFPIERAIGLCEADDPAHSPSLAASPAPSRFPPTRHPPAARAPPHAPAAACRLAPVNLTRAELGVIVPLVPKAEVEGQIDSDRDFLLSPFPPEVGRCPGRVLRCSFSSDACCGSPLSCR